MIWRYPETLGSGPQDEEHREIVRKLGSRSYMMVPLIARGETLGVISLVSDESGCVFYSNPRSLHQYAG